MLQWTLGCMYHFGSCFSTGIFNFLGWGFLMYPAVFHSYVILSVPDSCPKIFHFSLNQYSCFATHTNWILGLSFESPGVICILYNWTIFCSCVPCVNTHLDPWGRIYSPWKEKKISSYFWSVLKTGSPSCSIPGLPGNTVNQSFGQYGQNRKVYSFMPVAFVLP